MKKILALVLSLILSLSSIGAVADEGFTAKLDFEIYCHLEICVVKSGSINYRKEVNLHGIQ